MSKTSTYEDEILKLIFHNIGISEVGDATGLLPSTTEGSFYIALYSVTPTNTTNGTEATYSGYARVAVPRNATNWDISGSAPTRASNALAITFPSSTTAETSQQNFQPETSSLELTDAGDNGSNQGQIVFATDTGDDLINAIAGALNRGQAEGRFL